ncbi:MAG: hypothetical protein IKU09_07270 [Firmicutes bacterium]|nr:hypothetical protein [Bacillota bacterium]
MEKGMPYYCSISINKCMSNDVSGYLYQPYFGEQSFRSTAELIFLMEEQMMQLQRKQDSEGDVGSGVPVKPSLKAMSSAVFQIEVVAREHRTWQGFFMNPKWRKRKSFRSIKELLEYLQESLSMKVDGPNHKRTIKE